VRKKPVFKRVLLKLSGEALQGSQNYGVHSETVVSIAKQIKEVRRLGLDVAITIGGGNIYRGIAGATRGMDRCAADYMGMLATVINGIALQDAL